MTCSECGASVPDDARFCPECGHEVDRTIDGVPDVVHEEGGRLLRRGALLAAATVLSMIVAILLREPVLFLVAGAASLASLYYLLQGWGLRHGALWALDAVPGEARHRRDVLTWFWGDEHCPGCGADATIDSDYCRRCGHAILAPPRPAGEQIAFAFRRLVQAQPIEPPRTQAYEERESGETTHRYLLVALVLAVGGYLINSLFGTFVLDAVGVTLMTLVPGLLLLVWLRGLDRFEPEPWGVVLMAFGWGILCALFVIPINTIVVGLFAFPSIAGFTEELAKAAVVVFIASHRILRKEFNGPTDGLVYGGAAGLGFAAAENVDYVIGITALTGDVFAGLALRSVLMLNHMFWTGITGGFLGLMMLRHGRVGPRDLMIGFVPAMVLHGLNNLPWGSLHWVAGLVSTPILVTISAWFFFKLLAEALRDEQAWGYGEGQAPVEETA